MIPDEQSEGEKKQGDQVEHKKQSHLDDKPDSRAESADNRSEPQETKNSTNGKANSSYPTENAEKNLPRRPWNPRGVEPDEVRRWWMFRLTIAAVLLSLFANVITWYQACNYKQAARAQNRAYVGCLNTEIHLFSPWNEGTQLDVAIKNFGQTPAYNCRIKSTAKPFAAEFPDNPPYDIPADTTFQMIGGGGDHSIHFLPFKGLSDSLREQIDKQEISVYLYGTIVYDDIFTDTHTTFFCYRFHPIGDQHFGIYGKYNGEK